jgi:hypothetical protein
MRNPSWWQLRISSRLWKHDSRSVLTCVARKKNEHPAPDELLSLADGADAMLVTPADRLDAAFFNRVASSARSRIIF